LNRQICTDTKGLNSCGQGDQCFSAGIRWFPYWCGNKTTVVWNVYFGINSLSKATIFHVSAKNFLKRNEHVFIVYPGMSFRIDKRMLQGREQLDFNRAAADPAIVGQLEK
jgi:hypothetical protein